MPLIEMEIIDPKTNIPICEYIEMALLLIGSQYENQVNTILTQDSSRILYENENSSNNNIESQPMESNSRISQEYQDVPVEPTNQWSQTISLTSVFGVDFLSIINYFILYPKMNKTEYIPTGIASETFTVDGKILILFRESTYQLYQFLEENKYTLVKGPFGAGKTIYYFN